MEKLTAAEKVVKAALKKAADTGKPVKFEHFEGGPEDGFSGSTVGTAHPCGCVDFSTILSNGSLGWGGWTEACSWHEN